MRSALMIYCGLGSPVSFESPSATSQFRVGITAPGSRKESVPRCSMYQQPSYRTGILDLRQGRMTLKLSSRQKEEILDLKKKMYPNSTIKCDQFECILLFFIFYFRGEKHSRIVEG